MAELNGLTGKPHFHGRVESMTFDQYISSPVINGYQFPNKSYVALTTIENESNPGYLYYDGTQFSLDGAGDGTIQSVGIQYDMTERPDSNPIFFTRIGNVVQFQINPTGTQLSNPSEFINLVPQILFPDFVPDVDTMQWATVVTFSGNEEVCKVKMFTDGIIQVSRLNGALLDNIFFREHTNLSFIKGGFN